MKIDWLRKCATSAWKIQVNTRGAVQFSPRGKNCNSTISGEQFFSDIVSTSSSFFTVIGFLISLMDVIPLGRLHIRPIQWYLREF
jgi:hypothetical protein